VKEQPKPFVKEEVNVSANATGTSRSKPASTRKATAKEEIKFKLEEIKPKIILKRPDYPNLDPKGEEGAATKPITILKRDNSKSHSDRGKDASGDKKDDLFNEKELKATKIDVSSSNLKEAVQHNVTNVSSKNTQPKKAPSVPGNHLHMSL
jgi:hypothetical protein